MKKCRFEEVGELIKFKRSEIFGKIVGIHMWSGSEKVRYSIRLLTRFGEADRTLRDVLPTSIEKLTSLDLALLKL